MMAAANHEYLWRCTINAIVASNNTQIYLLWKIVIDVMDQMDNLKLKT